VVKEPRHFSIWERSEGWGEVNPDDALCTPPPTVMGMWRQAERGVPVSRCVEDSQDLLGSGVQRGQAKEWPVTGRVEVH
jgi:hypothetical protein